MPFLGLQLEYVGVFVFLLLLLLQSNKKKNEKEAGVQNPLADASVSNRPERQLLLRYQDGARNAVTRHLPASASYLGVWAAL